MLILKIMKSAHAKFKIHFKEVQTQKDKDLCLRNSNLSLLSIKIPSSYDEVPMLTVLN